VLSSIITLTTDFGLRDPYVAEMKATILNICKTAQIVDVTNQVDKFNIKEGAFFLSCIAPYFPDGTIHIGVVDPEVGTRRKPIIIETLRGFFVGPDNGLLALAAETQGIKHVYEISNRQYVSFIESQTFHGRDIFAPAAAHLLKGVSIEEFGPVLDNIVKPTFTKVVWEKTTAECEILHIDNFGNLITNLSAKELIPYEKNILQIKLSNFEFKLKLSKAYSYTQVGDPLVLIGGHGFLELAIYKGNAASKFSAKSGDKLSLSISAKF
jgi:S-adenosylmethionine hydrolase